MNQWKRTYEHGTDYMESLDGVAWFDAKLPPRWHRCRPQTRGNMGLDSIARCACGATYLLGGWIHKNETRTQRRRAQREAKLPDVTVTCASCGSAYEAKADSRIAESRLCTDCWSRALMVSHGYPDPGPRVRR